GARAATAPYRWGAMQGAFPVGAPRCPTREGAGPTAPRRPPRLGWTTGGAGSGRNHMPRRRAWLAIWSLPLVVGVAGGLVARDLWASLPDLEPLLDYRPALPSVVLDREGRPIAEFAAERRELVRLEAIPEP